MTRTREKCVALYLVIYKAFFVFLEDSFFGKVVGSRAAKSHVLEMTPSRTLGRVFVFRSSIEGPTKLNFHRSRSPSLNSEHEGIITSTMPICLSVCAAYVFCIGLVGLKWRLTPCPRHVVVGLVFPCCGIDLFAYAWPYLTDIFIC